MQNSTDVYTEAMGSFLPDIREAIGSKLKGIRTRNGFSFHQAAMRYARYAGMNLETSNPKGYIARVEQGQVFPKRKTLLLLAQAAGATPKEINDLLRTAEYLPEPRDPIESVAYALRTSAPTVSEESIRQVEEVVREILERESRGK